MPHFELARMVAASKRFGLRVEVVPGAERRGSTAFNPGGKVGHHTAGARTGDRPSLALCVNGRRDLAGPLCNDFLTRAGVDVIVATGRANHAGLGGFRGLAGNSAVWGTEAEDDGDGRWTAAQLAAYPRLVASRLWLIGRDWSWYCSHRTWANGPGSTPGRKIDPAGITDAWMQSQVRALLASGGVRPLAPPTPKRTFMTLTTAQEDKLVRAADAILGMTAPGQASAGATLAALLPAIQAVANRVSQGDGALADAITDTKSAVLGAVAALPTDGLSEEEQTELAENIAGMVSGLTVDEVLDAAGQRLYTPEQPTDPEPAPAG